MVRPQMYDRRQVIESAQQLFWRQGYQATTIIDLQEATELKPGSLYQAFGNKDGLLKEVLVVYADNTISSIDRLLDQSDSVKAMLEAFFALQVDRACGKGGGCLLVNCLLEFSGNNVLLEKVTRRQLQKIQKKFERVLQEAQQTGEFSSELNCAEKASGIMTALSGIGVMSRMKPQRNHLQVFADHFLNSLTAGITHKA